MKLLLKLADVLTMVFAVIFIAACTITAAYICGSIIASGIYTVKLDFNHISEGPVEMALFLVLFSCFLIRLPHIFKPIFARYDVKFFSH